MIRSAVPVALFLAAASAAAAETLNVPGLSPDPEPKRLSLPDCELTGDQDSCARVLACLGDQGLWFDGQARGWGQGEVYGQRSDGVVCAGTWAYGGVFNMGRARLECQDGLTARMVYTAQDPKTGTALAHGFDNQGRYVRGWTGLNVLGYLGQTEDKAATLPCSADPIPIS